MKAAFVGLGTMGAAMAKNILRAGHDLTVHNRTREREAPLAAAGAKRAATPAEAARDAEVVVTCVSDTPDVEAVLLGDGGVVHGARPGTIVADCSTISPAATRRMGAALATAGIRMLDAPVSGGSEGAVRGALSIMVGGDKEDLERAMPVFSAFGRTIIHVGPLGAGQMTKAINQIIICGTYLGLAEGLVLGMKAGLDMDKVLRAVAGGAAGSWVLSNRAGNILADAYPLGFRLRLHRKDLAIALEATREMGVFAPCAALVEQMENALIGRGFGDEDVSAIGRTIREHSGIPGRAE